MSKVYLKIMVSFEADEEKIIKNPKEEIKKALMNGAEVDGEVYFPMTDYNNETIYKLKDDGIEVNVDGALDGYIVKLIDE